MIMHDDPNPISRGRGLRLVPSLLVVLLVASVFVVSNGSNALSIGRSPGAHPASPAPTAVAPFYPNVKITDGSSPFAWQVEPTMVINETGTIFVGWKETTGPDTAGVRVGASYSTDQGLSWAPNILMNQSHPSNLQCQNSDPWMALAPDQRVQYAYLEFNCNDGTNGLDVSNTTNGQDWGTVHYKLGGGGLTDKDSITVAPSGRIYAAWDEANFMIVTRSDDGGSTWAPFHDPDDIPGGVLGAVVKTSANGTVYLTWWDFGSNNIFFDWSADGNTWHADKRVNDVLGSAPGQGSWQLAIPAMAIDPVTGAIYIAWPDSRNGDQDIFMSSSTDGGITWSANHRVNDDSGSHSQWMVDIAVDYASVVHAAWEDNRNGAWNIFYSNSTDGGSTWATNLRVSTQDTPLSYDRPGDYFAIEAGLDNTVYVVWTDGRGSDFDIYYARSPGFPTSTVTVTTDPVGLPVTVDGVTSGSHGAMEDRPSTRSQPRPRSSLPRRSPKKKRCACPRRRPAPRSRWTTRPIRRRPRSGSRETPITSFPSSRRRPVFLGHDINSKGGATAAPQHMSSTLPGRFHSWRISPRNTISMSLPRSPAP